MSNGISLFSILQIFYKLQVRYKARLDSGSSFLTKIDQGVVWTSYQGTSGAHHV